MMRTLLLPVLMLALLWPATSSADSAPAVVAHLGTSGTVYKLCDAETTESEDCQDASGDEIVLDTAGFSSIMIDFSESTAAAIACDAIGNNVGHDAASGTGQDLTATQFSTSQLTQTLPLTPRFVWINCTTITGPGNVTVTILGRPEK